LEQIIKENKKFRAKPKVKTSMLQEGSSIICYAAGRETQRAWVG